MFKKLIDAIYVIISEMRKPTRDYSQKDIKQLVISRDRKRLAKTCDIKKLESFCDALIPICQLEGFNPWCILAQSWHESGAFKRVIGNYNYWGIKKPRKWTGKVCSVITHEYEQGVKIKMRLDFIDFEHLSQAIYWYISLIQRLYPKAFINRDNPSGYFLGLIIGAYKYATDPEYVPKLESTYKKLKKNIFINSLLKT